jgi:two-component system KDP operon response regulator KdpE
VTKGSEHILVVDDEPSIRRFLRVSLSGHGYTVSEAKNGLSAIDSLVSARPDLVILDMGLPDISGLDVVRQAREWSTVPILILSVRDREIDKVEALDAGADDYLTKPFGLAELLARIRSALRRSSLIRDTGTVFRCHDLTVDLTARSVMMGEKRIQLTPTEYELLKTLVQQAGRVLTHHQILTKVWGEQYAGDAHMLRVNVSNLRRKLEPDPMRPRYLITEPGVGYRFRAE